MTHLCDVPWYSSCFVWIYDTACRKRCPLNTIVDMSNNGKSYCISKTTQALGYPCAFVREYVCNLGWMIMRLIKSIWYNDNAPRMAMQVQAVTKFRNNFLKSVFDLYSRKHFRRGMAFWSITFQFRRLEHYMFGRRASSIFNRYAQARALLSCQLSNMNVTFNR